MSHLLALASAPLGGTITEVKVAWWLLYVLFIVVPLVAGLDKFTHVLTDWNKYLSPTVASLLGDKSRQFMLAVGVIEIIVGICVIFWPAIFGFVVVAWLLGIVLNLLLSGRYLDVAFRDLGLAIAAAALGTLSLL